MIFRKTHTSGLSLVEVIIATSIILIFATAAIGVHTMYTKVSSSNVDLVKAAYLAEEGIEAVKLLRATSWDSNITPLSLGTPYYLEFVGGVWRTTTTPGVIDSRFERKIILSAVSRNSSSDIVSSGGTTDQNARKITATVSWSDRGATTTKAIDAYITNFFDN